MTNYSEDFAPLATMADAHREWHTNTGIPMGTAGCPQDACHPVEYDEMVDVTYFESPAEAEEREYAGSLTAMTAAEMTRDADTVAADYAEIMAEAMAPDPEYFF